MSLITIILAVFTFSGANLAYESLQNTFNKTQEKEIYNNEPKVEVIDIEEQTEKELKTKYNLEESTWQIEIPKIGLLAPISEGTTQEVMKKYVGHFENTSLWKGNIGLAAHNRRISYKLF